MDPIFQKTFNEQERQARISNSKLASFLAIILMPAGMSLDYFVYPQHLWIFLAVRILASCLIGLVWCWFLLGQEKHDRVFGVMWYMIPAAAIVWMIYYTKDPLSPYYAGLNLVLLAIGLLSPWTYVQNFLSATGVILMYLVACLWIRQPFSTVFNNLYFLSLTSIVVVAGSRAAYRLRFSEFSLRYELDKNRKSLEETNQKLVEMDRLKSRFFANVSHEMRTPLTLLLAPLDMLVKRYEQVFDSQTRDLLQTMHNNGMRLLKLINDLLELIRLEAGRLEIKSEPLSMAEFINGLASAARQMAVEKQIALEIQVQGGVGTVLTDRDKLEKIALNLLFNALKFTPPQGRVWVHAEKRGKELALVVGDTGMGIAEKSLAFVFDRFWQEDGSSKRKFQGVGIGLALVKELTEMMGGQVTVESQLGRGTVFTVRLPYKKADQDALAAAKTGAVAVGGESLHSEEWLANLYRRAEFFPTATAQEKQAGAGAFQRQTQRPLVLVADDEPDMRRFLVSQLADDYEIVEAVDGNDAAVKAQDILPDVILLDLMMPHKDGLQVCGELRAYAPTSGIPIILLTARADEEAKFDALQMGANDFLAKPFSSTELQARIRNLIESHHVQRKLVKQNQALSEAIDQIKETEMQLVQSEKLSSLGRMSAGIIHEINNPLNFSLTGLFALRNKGKKLPLEDRGEYEAIINDIEEGLKRVRNIVSELRTFTHPGGGTGEPVEAAAAAEAALRFLSGEWRGKVEIHQQISPAQMLWANRNKLIHILVNLLQNAIDALGEKTFDGNEQPQVWLTGKTVGDRSLIYVRDNGPGIDAKIMDKIFDPFFTTKEIGKGMGLGLSICYRITQGYGGKISVNSERERFCEFTLDFPADADAAAEMEIENGKSLRS